MTSKSTTHIPMTPIKAYEVQINEGSPQKKSARFSGYCTSLSAHLKSSAQRIAKVAIAVIESPKAACALAVSSAAGLAASYYTGDTTGLFPLYLCVGLGVQRFLDTFPLLENANGELPLIENETPQSSASAFRRFTDHAIRTALYTERYLAYEIHTLALDGLDAGIVTPLVAPLLGIQLSVILTSIKRSVKNADHVRIAWQKMADFASSQPKEGAYEFLKKNAGEASICSAILLASVTLSILADLNTSTPNAPLTHVRNFTCFLAGMLGGKIIASSALKLKFHALAHDSKIMNITSKITTFFVQHPGIILTIFFAKSPSPPILSSFLFGLPAGMDVKMQNFYKCFFIASNSQNNSQNAQSSTAFTVQKFLKQHWMQLVLTPGIVSAAYLASLNPQQQPYTATLVAGLAQYYSKKAMRYVHNSSEAPIIIKRAAQAYLDLSSKYQFSLLSVISFLTKDRPFNDDLIITWGFLGLFLGDYHDNFEQIVDLNNTPQPSYAVGISL